MRNITIKVQLLQSDYAIKIVIIAINGIDWIWSKVEVGRIEFGRIELGRKLNLVE